MVVNNTVNGNKSGKPTQYDDFGKNRIIVTRAAGIQKGNTEKGIGVRSNQKDRLGIFCEIRDWKQKGTSLNDVTFIQAKPIDSKEAARRASNRRSNGWEISQ